MKKLFFIIITVFLALQGNSQSLEVGLFGGGSYYVGDINPMMHFRDSQLGFGLIMRSSLDKRWAVKITALRGSVKSDDEVINFREDRRLRFNSPITEVAVTGELNFLDYFTGSKQDYMTPYIFAGVAVFQFKPQVTAKNLKEIGTEGQNFNYKGNDEYSLTSFAIPFGIGFKYSLSKKLGFSAEWGLRKTVTDYIDDVSTTYFIDSENITPDDELWNVYRWSDPTRDHYPGQQRGNSTNDDWYSFFGIMLTYKINLVDKTACREFQTGGEK